MNNTLNIKRSNNCEIKNTPLERLGMQVSLRRRQAGYSLESFAQLTCIPLDELAAIELGLASERMVLSHLEKISKGLGLPTRIFPKFLSEMMQP